jgi:hypothetical protein
MRDRATFTVAVESGKFRAGLAESPVRFSSAD